MDLGTLLGGVGIGAIVGSAVTGIFTALNGRWQRDHDREMRGIDHGQEAMAQTVRQQHELALRQFEDKQRLRDRRLAELKAGLTEMVEAFVALTAEMQQVRLGPTHQQGANAAREEAVKHFEVGRTLLVLDPAGREMMQKFREINTEIILFATMQEDHRIMVQARQPEVVEHGLRMALQEKEVFKLAGEAVDRAQQIMEQAAQPVT